MLIKIIGATALADGAEVEQTVETTGTQRGMLQLLQAEPLLMGLTFRGQEAEKDKITRCNPWLARAEQKRVKLVRGAWNNDWLDEVCGFPESEHDDLVDATSGAFQAVAQPALYFKTIEL